MGILVKEPGIFTTVQDGGRVGFQQYGVTPSGPMDERAFAQANLLVGNPEGTEELEMTFSGGRYLFEEAAVIALTGADMKPTVNGEPIPMYRAVSIAAGQELVLGFAVNGCRTYMAVTGGLEVTPVMGSKATLAGKHLGGIDGRKIMAGDNIGLTASVPALKDQAKRVFSRTSYPRKEITLRVVPGPQNNGFSREEYRKFFWYGAEITNECDRQGCRLQRKEPVRHIGDGNIISDGIAFGSIQIPPNGQPIIMMADRQTVGGYPKIGTVISVDLPLLAQARPGMKVRFVEVGIELAQELYLREKQTRKQIAERWGNA